MAEQYASIIIDISHENVDRVFQYRIPPQLLGEIQVGMQVCVPFGSGNRTRTGYVVDISEKAEYDVTKMKSIAGIVAGSVTADSRIISLAWWMKERYGSTMNQALKTVLPVKRKVKARNRQVVRSMVDVQIKKAEILLNEEQRQIAEDFCSRYDRGDRAPSLIYGITGSGKTEVYMEMISHVLKQGRQVIVLIPEISLTYQTVMRFYRRFGSCISVMHSRLSAGERWDQYERARQGETQVMIGARSALFTDFPDLGLIIMDEEHEGAYKSESTPRYHAREVAEKLAGMRDAAFVMGSATPSLEAYTRAREGIYRLYTLKNRAGEGSVLAAAEVVDLRKEMEAGNKSIFSRRLQELIRDRLEKKEQVMLFMNRRGYSSFVSCRSCGEAVKCPHCDVTLTLHNKTRLVCHYCGYTVPLPKKCPSCGSPYLAGFGTGTQKIEELTKAMFPQARVLRMDLDTTSKKGGHQEILSAFAKGEADILIGTQMIVKGHDFPGVTLVGILAADASLYAPDYRSGERTFQLLVQAAGRAGRGKKPGTAVIQTYTPEHYVVKASAVQDYLEFYRQEMGYRKLMKYPPAAHMLSIQIGGKEEELTAHMTEAVAEAVGRRFGQQAELIGPVFAPVYKVNDIYRKILYIKHENYDILLRIRGLAQKWEENRDSCKNVMIQYDG